MTYNDSFQVTEHGLLYVIHKVELFTEDGFIASLYVRNYSEVDLLLKIAEVRECLCIAHREFLSLSKFSLTFNTRWATEDNERFSSAQVMLNKLRSSLASIKRSFRETCPIVRKQQPQAAVFRDRLSPSVYEFVAATNVISPLLLRLCRSVYRNKYVRTSIHTVFRRCYPSAVARFIVSVT
jgi:hypothetical protein